MELTLIQRQAFDVLLLQFSEEAALHLVAIANKDALQAVVDDELSFSALFLMWASTTHTFRDLQDYFTYYQPENGASPYNSFYTALARAARERDLSWLSEGRALE